MLFGNRAHIGTGTVPIIPQRQQIAAIPNVETQNARAAQKRKLLHVTVAETPIAIGIAQRPDQADLLLLADRFGRQSRLFGHFTDVRK